MTKADTFKRNVSYSRCGYLFGCKEKKIIHQKQYISTRNYVDSLLCKALVLKENRTPLV